MEATNSSKEVYKLKCHSRTLNPATDKVGRSDIATQERDEINLGQDETFQWFSTEPVNVGLNMDADGEEEWQERV